MTEQIANGRITFRRPLPTSRGERLCVLLTTCCVVIAVFYGPDLGVVYGLVGASYLTNQLVKYRRGVSADGTGLHRPLRRVLPWGQVHAIEEPSELRPELVLWCTDGKGRGTFLPIEYADELSRISGKPIRSEKSLRRPLPKVEVRETRHQGQDDFAARATRIKPRNAELLGEHPPTKRVADG